MKFSVQEGVIHKHGCSLTERSEENPSKMLINSMPKEAKSKVYGNEIIEVPSPSLYLHLDNAFIE